MDAALFAADLERKPASLMRLADQLSLHNPWADVAAGGPYDQVVLVGMGSSQYAASVIAARLRAAGVVAVAELAGSDLLPRVGRRSLVVAISASGRSVETLDAVGRLETDARLVALTNDPASELAQRCDAVVDLHAGDEHGGVACLSFAHTIALLLALEAHLLAGRGQAGSTRPIEALLRAAARATAHLLDSRETWLAPVTDLLAGPGGTHVVAPARRLSSAQQSALMLREGPRLPAVACETADWSHVDVYLTKTMDYRLLLLGGSRWEGSLLGWVRERGSTLVAVGPSSAGPDAAYALRYPGDEEDDVRLLTETTVAELTAARLWLIG